MLWHIQHPLCTAPAMTPMCAGSCSVQKWGHSSSDEAEHVPLCEHQWRFHTTRLNRPLTNGMTRCKSIFFSPKNEVSPSLLTIGDSPRSVLSLQLCPEIVWESASWPWLGTPLPHNCCCCANNTPGSAWPGSVYYHRRSQRDWSRDLIWRVAD